MNRTDHTRTVSRRFSMKAKAYSEQARLQPSLAEQLIALAPAEAPRTPVLEIGCGSGQLTRHILRRWPGAEIHAVDIAPGMIRHAERQFANEPRVKWILADAMTYRSGACYDLLLSNCALHWLHPFRDGMKNLIGQLSENGLLACSVMLDGTLSELHDARMRAAPLKPPAGRLPTFQEVLDLLGEDGMAISYASEEHRLVTLPHGEDVLRMVHDQGLTGGHVSRSHLPLNRGELAELVRDYNFNYRTEDGSVRLSYHVGLFVARKSAAPA